MVRSPFPASPSGWRAPRPKTQAEPSIAQAGLCCPNCRGPLRTQVAHLRCEGCGELYPVVAGIPDLRICSDPYIVKEQDREKALHLAERSSQMTFPELVAYYYSITPEVPPELVKRFRAHHLAGVERGESIRNRLTAYFPEARPGPECRVLDLGCGTAGFLAAMSDTGAALVGVDIALRWLVVARRRLEELGVSGVRLVCACADHLPLADHCCDWIVAENLLEHVSDSEALLGEVYRVARPGGRFMARTVNRYVLGPEPHVDVWGVGFLPRRWMDGFVRWRRGVPYDKIHLRSYMEFRRQLRQIGGGHLRLRFPRLEPGDFRHQSPARRLLLDGYRRLGSRARFMRPLLALFGPFLDLVGKPGALQR